MKNPRIYLGHIRAAIEDITTYAAVGRDAFMGDRMRQDAVIRKLEIIGEAVKQLSDETTRLRPEIPTPGSALVRCSVAGRSHFILRFRRSVPQVHRTSAGFTRDVKSRNNPGRTNDDAPFE